MIQAFIKFNKGLMASPVGVKMWLMFLVFFNLLAPLLLIQHLEAKVTVACLLASMILMTIITRYDGFTRILGVGHIFWVPLIYFLWTRLGQHPGDDIFGIWMRSVIVVNTISLVIDVTDVIRYIAGDRKETVSVCLEPSKQA